jgi:hypothetical protein
MDILLASVRYFICFSYLLRIRLIQKTNQESFIYKFCLHGCVCCTLSVLIG